MDGFSTTAPPGRKRSFVYGILICLLATPAAATTWEVGPARPLNSLTQVARQVKDGDRVVLDPGIYRECAIWTASRLTIEARRPSASVMPSIMTRVVITGPVCGDRALFYFVGNDITVRGLIFAGARDTWHNGAGILMEGSNLTVENSQFLNGENGILAGGSPASVLRVRNSLFQGNGSCEGACAHALYAGGRIALLEVTHCNFRDTHTAHHIKSRAHVTIVRDSRIEDGETGNSSYLIELPDGGDADIGNNYLEKGPKSENREAAISIGVPGGKAVSANLDIHGNRFVNDMPDPVLFVRNETTASAHLRGNTLVGRVQPLQGPGTVE